jgi:uncharacterized Fe-S center protein
MQYNPDTNVEEITLFLPKSEIYNNTLPDKTLSIKSHLSERPHTNIIKNKETYDIVKYNILIGTCKGPVEEISEVS